MDSVPERLIAWLLRGIAGVMLFGGAASLVAAVPASSLLTDAPVLRAIGAHVLQIGGGFLAAGAIAKVLLRPRGVLPNERVTAEGDQRPPVGGWLIAVCVALIATPVWLVLRLRPFLAEWRQVTDLLTAPGMWDTANANGSGLVLVPLAGALTPPFIELIAMTAFIGASALLVPLLLSRSPKLPRFYLVSTVLLSALVFGSLRGASAATLAADELRQFAVTTSVNAEDTATVTGTLDRYTTAVVTTVPPLAVTLLAYLVWVPPLLRSPRAVRTFARRPEPAAPTVASPVTVEAITNPPRFPGMGF